MVGAIHDSKYRTTRVLFASTYTASNHEVYELYNVLCTVYTTNIQICYVIGVHAHLIHVSTIITGFSPILSITKCENHDMIHIVYITVTNQRVTT